MSDAESFVIGLLVGFATGFFPGMHPNMLISAMSTLRLDERFFAIMIIAIYPANLITALVPSIFFGIPDSRTVMAILPGQRMVIEGKGVEALKVMLLSSILAALVSNGLIYFSLDFFTIVYGIIKQHMKWILLVISLLLLTRTKKPHISFIFFLLSGVLGKLTFETNMQDPFLPLFSGMYAMAAIINYRKSNVPEQRDEKMDFGFVFFVFIGSALGMLADLIPGVGSPAQVAVFATMLVSMNTLNYLAVISSISVSQAIFSLSTVAAIGKSRIGAIAWLSEYINVRENMIFLAALFIISMAVAVFVIYLLRKIVGKITAFDFSKLNFFLALYLIGITLVIDGIVGIAILILATALGWLCVKFEVERTNLMGSIIVPTLVLLFRIF